MVNTHVFKIGAERLQGTSSTSITDLLFAAAKAWCGQGTSEAPTHATYKGKGCITPMFSLRDCALETLEGLRGSKS